MSAQNKPDFQSEVWPKIRKVIGDIVEKSADGDYIYRGESKCYEKVSSGLYRAYSSSNMGIKDIPGAIQASVEKILSEAKAYLDEPDDSEILTQLQLQRGTVDPYIVLLPGLEAILARAQASLGKSTDFKILASLQHYGLKTNLIDFTTNPLVALFFACNSPFDEDGRIIVLKRQPAKDFCIKEAPPIIRHAVSQRSIFVEAHKGFIKRGHYEVIRIGKCLKLPVQKYLEKSYGISTKGVYGDIHGFIRTSDIYPDPYRKLLDGRDCFKNAVETKKPEEQLQGYKKAIEIFTGILDSKRDLPEAYLNRGGAHFQLGEHYMEANEKDKAEREYDKAITDYKAVITQYPDYADAYAERGKAYNSMDEFQRALEDFDRAIGLDPNQPIFYFERAIIRLCRQEWDEARADLEAAGNQGVSLKHLFNQEISDFEKRYDVVLPEAIVEILTSDRPL